MKSFSVTGQMVTAIVNFIPVVLRGNVRERND